ncbi:hypothetical protein Tco_1078264 [Tanacetum coccineum]
MAEGKRRKTESGVGKRFQDQLDRYLTEELRRRGHISRDGDLTVFDMEQPQMLAMEKMMKAAKWSTTATIGSIGPTATPGYETTLPHAFVVGTLHEPTTGA